MTSKTLSQTVHDTDIANAKRFASQNADKVAYSQSFGWFVFDGQRWVPDSDGVLALGQAMATAETMYDLRNEIEKNEMFKWVKRSQSSERLTAMLKLARPALRQDINNFDANPMLMNCRNGTLNLETGELMSHNPTNLISMMSPVEYDTSAECLQWVAFLDKIMCGNQDVIDYLQRAVGYSLTGSNVEQCLFFLHGNGANGKSVFTETLHAMLGDYSAASRPDVIMKRQRGGIPNDLARLRGLRFVAMNETSEGQKMDEQVVKDITGGDTISARFLHKEFFDYVPAFKLWIRGNYKPVINGTDEGIWRRIHLVPFTYHVPAHQRDKYLFEKLKQELPGIMNWAVQGCMNWQQQGLNAPEEVVHAVDDYREESDTLQEFIDIHCDVAPGLKVSCAKLLKSYSAWAVGEGVDKTYNKNSFAPALAAKGFPKTPRSAMGYYYEGLKLRQDDSVVDMEARRYGN